VTIARVIRNVRPSASASLESDWQARIANSVWYHDFRTSREVDNFRWTLNFGNNPNAATFPSAPLCRRITSDGITGACLEIVRDATVGDGNFTYWQRPFVPMSGGTTTGNGRGVGEDDPAANGTVPLYTDWDPSNPGEEEQFSGGGWYGTDTSGPGGAAEFTGEEYFMQARVKMDPRRRQGINADEQSGKLFYFTRSDRSGTDQEIVVESYRAGGGNNNFYMYRSFSPALAEDSPGIAVHGNQPGTEFGSVGDGACRFDNNGGRYANCWFWPDDEWVTMQWAVRPGDNGSGGTHVRVWAARYGETAFTKIWDQPDVDLPFDASFPFGHNALICSVYHNGATMTEFWHRYCQIIFAHQFIACPQVYA
jgi:hypothetical protein